MAVVSSSSHPLRQHVAAVPYTRLARAGQLRRPCERAVSTRSLCEWALLFEAHLVKGLAVERPFIGASRHGKTWHCLVCVGPRWQRRSALSPWVTQWPTVREACSLPVWRAGWWLSRRCGDNEPSPGGVHAAGTDSHRTPWPSPSSPRVLTRHTGEPESGQDPRQPSRQTWRSPLCHRGRHAAMPHSPPSRCGP